MNLKKKDVRTNVRTFVEGGIIYTIWGSIPLMTNTLSGAGYKSDPVKMCMLLMVKTLSGARYLSEV